MIRNLQILVLEYYINSDNNGLYSMMNILMDFPELKENEFIDWKGISGCKLSEEFIKKFETKVDWFRIFKFQKLSESYIIERYDKKSNKMSWKYISEKQNLSEKFISRFKNKLDWERISRYQKLSEGFIDKFQNKINWEYISYYQKLSEGFIEKFQNKIDWKVISE